MVNMVEKAAEPVAILPELHTPDRVWLELHREKDSCDVIVQMDDGTVYTALFVTLPYLHRQMELSYEVTRQLQTTPAVRYAALDTTHILVEDLAREVIEDTIDNLIALDVFESYFIRVTAHETDDRTSDDGKLATQEVAAVVISDVLVVQE